jgi:hypothetical protein
MGDGYWRRRMAGKETGVAEIRALRLTGSKVIRDAKEVVILHADWRTERGHEVVARTKGEEQEGD